MSRKIKIIFTLSVLLNIIFLGVIGGGMLRIYNHFGQGEFRKEIESLPEDVQKRIDMAFRSSRQEMRNLFKEARDAKEAVRNSLNAESFDPQAYQEASEALNQVRYRMMQTQARKTGSIASELSAEERRRFAGYLMRGGRKGGFETNRKEGTLRRPQENRSQQTSIQSPQSATNAGQTKAGQNEPFDPVMLPMPDFN